MISLINSLINSMLLLLGVSPSEAQLQAARDLLSCGVDSGKLSPTYKLLAHKQVRQTSCPGNSLYAIIKQWPNWAPNP